MKGFKITTIHAFVATEKDGTEGIIGMMTGAGWVLFIGADSVRVNELKPIAKKLAKEQKVPVKLVRFSVREDLEDIG